LLLGECGERRGFGGGGYEGLFDEDVFVCEEGGAGEGVICGGALVWVFGWTIYWAASASCRGS
jgi:hypothetical protein